jgi:hypothetical protein
MMKVDLYTSTWNEIKLLPYFFRHYDTFVDRYFVWDDHSTDGTREILEQHSRVTLYDTEVSGGVDDYFRYCMWPQYIAKSRGKADWVFCVDIDEIMWHPDIPGRLQELYDEGCDVIRPVGFLMIGDSLPSHDGQLYDMIKNGFRDRVYDKKVIFRPDVNIIFTPGKHRIEHLSSGVGKKDLRIRMKSGFKLLHYRYFGIDHFIARLTRNCERLKMANTPSGNCSWLYRDDKRCTVPDNTRKDPKEWYPANLDKVIRVIE